MLKNSLNARPLQLLVQVIVLASLFAFIAAVGFLVSKTLRDLGLHSRSITLLVFFFDTSALFISGLIYYLWTNRTPRYSASHTKGALTPLDQKNYTGQTPHSLESIKRTKLHGVHPRAMGDSGLSPTHVVNLHRTKVESTDAGKGDFSHSSEHAEKSQDHLTLVADLKKRKIQIEDYQQLCVKRERLAKIITEAKQKIEFFEENMIDKMNRVTCGAINNIVTARRIANALEGRMIELDSYLAFPSAENFLKAHRCLNEDLVVPNDSFSSVMSAQDLPPLPATAWEPTLEKLFSRIISRKEIFRSSILKAL